MTKTRRIGLYVGLAILGNQAAADAQTPSNDATQPGAVAPAQPDAAARRASPATRDVAPAPAATRRPQASSYYNRVTATSRRGSAYSTPRGTTGGMGSGAYAQNDPLRPYSAQARQSAATISPTRVAEAPPPPPRVEPQARYNYFPGMRTSRHPNANVPQSRPHCTPSRGGVMAGSPGGGAMGGSAMGGSLGRSR